MKQKTRCKTRDSFNYAVIPIILIVLLSGLGIGTVIASPGNRNDDDMSNSITTTGTATMSIDPNKLEVYLGVETQANSAQDCQQENAMIINDIRAALISSGIDADSINTYKYNIYPMREYDEWRNTQKISGYRTIHILKIETENVNIAGSIIDTAVDNGANKIENVLFTMTDELMNQKKTELLASAALSAREKANSIAGALGVSIVRVLHATEGYNTYTPYRYNMEYATAGMASVDYPTQITPGEIQISATVTVDFEIA